MIDDKEKRALLDDEDMQRILVDFTLGKPPAREDTPGMADFRRRMEVQVAEIKEKGYVIDLGIPMDED